MTRSLFCCLLLYCLSASLNAQSGDSLSYAGPYLRADFRGQAQYDYALRRRDTVRQGAFTFSGADARALLEGTDRPFTFSGQYDGGEPVGRWALTFGEYGFGGPVDFVDGRYAVAVDGTRHLATGLLRGGVPDSVWTQTIHRIEDSEATEVLLHSEVNFLEGVARQSVKMEAGTSVLLGRVQRNGVAEDEWTLYTELETAQQWTFDDGRLLHVVSDPEAAPDTVAVLPVLSGKTELVDLDARYLDWLSLQLRLQGRGDVLEGNTVVALLTANARAYARTFEAIRALGGEAGRPIFRVRLPVDPLSRQELTRLEEIDAHLREVDTVSRSLLNNTALSVVENADPEVASLREAVTNLRDSLLQPVRTLRETYARGILPYVSRRDYLAYLWPAPVTEGERTFDAGRDGLAAVAELTDYARRRVDSIRVTLGRKSNTRERQRATLALEEQLTREQYLLDSLLESRESNLPEEFGLGKIRELARENFRRYTANQDVLDREESAQQLIGCVEDLNALALQLIRLPGQLDEVRTAYTNEVWNNFTATVMEERIKKRLYRAYDDRLITYYLEQVREGLTCDRARALGAELETIHSRMLELSDQDTDDLEDRLRRIDDPARIRELLTASEPQ